MKVYLILSYNMDKQGNVWADVQAYTSEKVRDETFAAIPGDPDIEKQDIEVQKRPYQKKHPQVEQEQTSGLGNG
jgi:hypothetical protein